MPINTDPQFVGRAWLTPAEPVVAGQLGTWTLSYEVGAYGYDERARLSSRPRTADRAREIEESKYGGCARQNGAPEQE